jgi:hypothetical protein
MGAVGPRTTRPSARQAGEDITFEVPAEPLSSRQRLQPVERGLAHLFIRSSRPRGPTPRLNSLLIRIHYERATILTARSPLKMKICNNTPHDAHRIPRLRRPR